MSAAKIVTLKDPLSCGAPLVLDTTSEVCIDLPKDVPQNVSKVTILCYLRCGAQSGSSSPPFTVRVSSIGSASGDYHCHVAAEYPISSGFSGFSETHTLPFGP